MIEVTLDGYFGIGIALVSVCCIAFNSLLPRAVFMLLLLKMLSNLNTLVSIKLKVIELS